MNKLVYTDNVLSQLDNSKTYTKSDIEHILNDMRADYDMSVASRRIRHFSGLVSQSTLEEIVNAISDTNEASLFD